jgi:transcriptional regulator with XRE-family HTH domain
MLSRKQISLELRFELSTLLKQLRQQRGVSQEELAFAVEMTQPSISNYESGRCEIPLSVLISICGFLGVSLDELVPGEFATHLAKGQRALDECSSGAELREFRDADRPDVAAPAN